MLNTSRVIATANTQSLNEASLLQIGGFGHPRTRSRKHLSDLKAIKGSGVTRTEAEVGSSTAQLTSSSSYMRRVKLLPRESTHVPDPELMWRRVHPMSLYANGLRAQIGCCRFAGATTLSGLRRPFHLTRLRCCSGRILAFADGFDGWLCSCHAKRSKVSGWTTS
jgi:hypothetical protein